MHIISIFYIGYICSVKNTDGTGLKNDERKLRQPSQSIYSPFKTDTDITEKWFSLVNVRTETRIGLYRYSLQNIREVPPEFQPS
jgi:hypothetical protein